MTILIIIIFAIYVVGMLYFKFKLPTIKGKIGEKGVSAVLSFLSDNKYVVLNDMMFRDGSHTTQIDHIVISIYGIFIIETKNYKGWIYGHAYSDYWTQNIWGNKYSLYNPILQNNNHIRFLLRKFSCLCEKKPWIYSIVVFLRASQLNISGDSEGVLWLRELYSYVRSFKQEIMTIDDCHYIASILKAENIIDKKDRKTHKYNVKASINRHHTNNISYEICPFCGHKLVVRNGKYGEFYGCSNYPRCKYTRQN